MSERAKDCAQLYAERTVQLRGESREAIQTLSNARRADVWEIVNKLILLERVRDYA